MRSKLTSAGHLKTWKLQEDALQAREYKRGRSRSHFGSFYRLSIIFRLILKGFTTYAFRRRHVREGSDVSSYFPSCKPVSLVFTYACQLWFHSCLTALISCAKSVFFCANLDFLD